MKFFKRTIKDYTDSELNSDFAEWQKYARLVSIFPSYKIAAPDLPYSQDEIQGEIFRRQNEGSRLKSFDVNNAAFKAAKPTQRRIS